MRFVLISDTHTMHRKLVIPDGDVIIHSGDATWTGTIAEIGDFGSWFAHVGDFKHRIFIAGNHDKLFENGNSLARTMLPSQITYLHDDLTYIDGLAVYGAPWTPRFGHGWAFNVDRGEDLADKWYKIPDFVNILVTHGPPFGIGDEVPLDVPTPTGKMFKSVGDQDLRDRVRELKDLRLHVFGHIHEGGGVHQKKFVNASMTDELYNDIRTPIVFDIN